MKVSACDLCVQCGRISTNGCACVKCLDDMAQSIEYRIYTLA
jgi:hypothetical protein